MGKNNNKNNSQKRKHPPTEDLPPPEDAPSSSTLLTSPTPTQLRNARKRRAKQQKRGAQSRDDILAFSNNNNNTEDPSLQYCKNPRAAPVVKAAQQFFRAHLGSQHKFVIYCGVPHGWRTVVKLAVRSSSNSSRSTTATSGKSGLLSIGLFRPGTHTLVPVVVSSEDGSDTAGCAAHHPTLNVAVACVQREARRLGMTPYDERTGTGQLRHVLAAVQRHTQRVQLTLVWNAAEGNDTKKDANDPLHPAYALCRALLGSEEQNRADPTITTTKTNAGPNSVQWHSIWLHENAEWKHSNAIVSHTGSWKQLYPISGGDEKPQTTTIASTTTSTAGMLTEYLGPLSNTSDNKQNSTSETEIKFPLHFPPQVFRQANLTGFTAIVQSIRRYMLDFDCTNKSDVSSHPRQNNKNRPRCLELYGGVGTIGLHIADLCHSLVCSDENPYNQACFQASADILLQPLRHRQKHDNTSRNNHHIPTIHYESQSAAQMVARDGALQDVDVVIVDPPRKGLEPSVCAALAAAAANEHSTSSLRLLIYVSCGFAAFQRDYQILCGGPSAGWRLRHAEGHILFPGSNAIETLAFFVRL